MRNLMILVAIIASYLAVSNEAHALTLPEAMAMSNNDAMLARGMLVDNKNYIDSRCGSESPKTSVFNNKSMDWVQCVTLANMSYPNAIMGMEDPSVEGFYMKPKSEWHTPSINLLNQ